MVATVEISPCTTWVADGRGTWVTAGEWLELGLGLGDGAGNATGAPPELTASAMPTVASTSTPAAAPTMRSRLYQGRPTAWPRPA